MSNNNSSNEYLRGTLKTIVLNILAEKKRMYGYEITREVKEHTEGEIQLSFGALYPVLHKLEQDGLLITETEEVDGRLRKYYSLTTAGNQTAHSKTKELEKFLNALQNLIAKPSTQPT